jgi:amino-acid N-acetyltransferase
MEKLDFKYINLIKELLIENNLPVSDLNDRITFFVEKNDNEIIAAGGIEDAGTDAIIRSIAVAENYKGKGYGAQITRQLLNYAKTKNKKDIYLLTTTADNYFPRFGFKEVKRQDLPAALKSSSQYKDVCPSSAVIMKLKL